MSLLVLGRLVGSNDARRGIYADRRAGQTQDRSSNAIPEYGCHCFAIRGRSPGRFTEIVYRIDKPSQILNRLVALNIAAVASGTELTGENTPDETETTV